MSNQPQLYSMVPLLHAAELASLKGNHAALGAYNVNFPAQGAGIIRGLMQTDSPGIIQASSGANKFQGGPDRIQKMVLSAIGYEGAEVPIALHLDHGNVDSSKDCVDDGFSSVMIDASEEPEQENIATTTEIVRYAHERGVSVEGEYGMLKGVEEDISHTETTYADPRFVPVFLIRTGADALAISYGTSHGPNKGKTDALDLTIVKDSYEALKALRMNESAFLVSHGSSAVPIEFVAKINEYGGTLEGTSGVPEYMIVRAIANGMRKVNIDTDLRLAMTGAAREYFANNQGVEEGSEPLTLIKGVLDGKIEAYDVKSGKVVPAGEIFDPRTWLAPIMDELDPTLLREDYHGFDDSKYIEFMDLMRDVVASHVANLNTIFGAAGLASKVDTSLTLEQMARRYREAA